MAFHDFTSVIKFVSRLELSGICKSRCTLKQKAEIKSLIIYPSRKPVHHFGNCAFTYGHDVIVINHSITVYVVIFQVTRNDTSESLLSTINDIFSAFKKTNGFQAKFLTNALTCTEEVRILTGFFIHFKDFIACKGSVEVDKIIYLTDAVRMLELHFKPFVFRFSKIGRREISRRNSTHVRYTLRQDQHVFTFLIKKIDRGIQ